MARPASILIVEDNETNGILFKDVLEMQHHEVRVARNGFEALKLLEEWIPDLILMDIHLPELDGLSVIRAIRSQPELSRVKIIGISALEMEQDIQKAFEAGCNGYLTKPISIARFVAEVNRYLAQE